MRLKIYLSVKIRLLNKTFRENFDVPIVVKPDLIKWNSNGIKLLVGVYEETLDVVSIPKD